MNIEIAKLRRDGGTQPRAGIHSDVVDDYAEALAEGASFPPVTVFHDGTDYWLADGFHRVGAFEKAGHATIPADVRRGTRRDAVLFSAAANATHGQPRTREDKWRAVSTLLLDDEWGKWPSREIARRCSVSLDFVNQLRKSLQLNETFSKPGFPPEMPDDVRRKFDEIERRGGIPRLYKRNGRICVMDVSGIGASDEDIDRIRRERDAAIERIRLEKDAEIEALREKHAEDRAHASRREANLIERANAAEKEKARAIAEAGLRAQETLKDHITQVEAEAAESRRLAGEKTRVLDAAVAKARAEAELAARENADALAAAALAKSAAEVKALEAKAQKALAQSQAALEAKNRIEEEIERHREVLARTASAETEGLDQARLASDVAEFIGKSMSELSLFEREIQPLAIHKFEVAAQMCEQFATALRTFAAPRLAQTLSTEPREIN
ncbi:MAG: hypothetical protein H7840_17665 [Alphaproteobacteria bacterium]